MNGQIPNNQLNQNTGDNLNNGINPNVLGSIGEQVNQSNPNVAPATPGVAATQSEPINPTSMNANSNIGAPATNMETVNSTTPIENINSQPVAQPIPGTAGTPYQAESLTGNTVGVGTPTMSQENLNVNGFVEPNKTENIGIVPPPNNTNEQKPKKKGMNKTLFVVLIIVLIAAIAFGVYYFLNASQTESLNINLKDITVGVGETLSDNINDYATISGSDASSCTLNIQDVDPNTIGEYPFTITCGEQTYRGTVNVSDITPPEITLNTVYTSVNTQTLNIEDFVESCTDVSECTTSFVDETASTNYLTTAGGPYNIEINVSDNAGNSTTATGQLYVTPYDISLFRSCESPSTDVENYQATKTTMDYLPMGNDDTGTLVYLGVSQRIYTYVFANMEEYYSVIGDKPQTLTFDNITGQASYNDDDLTFQITTDLSINTLNTEAGGTYPSTYVELGTYYTNLGYVCSNTLPGNR